MSDYAHDNSNKKLSYRRGTARCAMITKQNTSGFSRNLGCGIVRVGNESDIEMVKLERLSLGFGVRVRVGVNSLNAGRYLHCGGGMRFTVYQMPSILFRNRGVPGPEILNPAIRIRTGSNKSTGYPVESG